MEETELLLFIDDMRLSTQNIQENFVRASLELVRESDKIARYNKIHT